MHYIFVQNEQVKQPPHPKNINLTNGDSIIMINLDKIKTIYIRRCHIVEKRTTGLKELSYIFLFGSFPIHTSTRKKGKKNQLRMRQHSF